MGTDMSILNSRTQAQTHIHATHALIMSVGYLPNHGVRAPGSRSFGRYIPA